IVGVGATPRSCTVQPAPSRPASTACRSTPPLGRPSRLRTTAPPRAWVPRAAAKARAASGVKPRPTTPRTPETLTIRPASLDILTSPATCFCLPHSGGGAYSEFHPPQRPRAGPQRHHHRRGAEQRPERRPRNHPSETPAPGEVVLAGQRRDVI